MKRLVLILPAFLAACGGGGGPSSAINLPVTAQGSIIAVELDATQTSQVSQGRTIYNTRPTEAQANDRTAAALDLTISGDRDPSGGTTVVGPNAQRVDALYDAGVTGALQRGGTFTDVTGVSGTALFQDGNFGDYSAATNAQTQLAGVSVYRPDLAGEIVLTKVAIVQMNSFDSGTNTGTFGVGFVGDATPAGDVPVSGSQPATYRAFLEQGPASVYDNGTTRPLFIRGVGSSALPAFDIIADFTAGTVTADIRGIELVGDNAATGSGTTVLNPNVERLFMQGNITGNTVAGTNMALQDATGSVVGTLIAQQVSGGFFGNTAQEVALVGILEGAMQLDDGTGSIPSDYVLSVTLGGAR